MSDIIIIGGGIAGVAAAAFLAPHAAVTLLETEADLGYHASGRSAAMFLETYGNRAVRALNSASAATLHEAGVLSPKDMLLLGHPEDGAERFEAERRSFEMEEISLAEAAARVSLVNPATCAQAGWRSGIYALDTDLLMQYFVKRARAAGARLLTRAPVSALERAEGGGWHVTAGGTRYEAAHVVNAAGAWADEIAGLAGLAPLGLVPYRRSMVVLPPPDGIEIDAWPFIDTVGERWYAKPDSGTLLVSPGDEDPMPPMDAWPDDMVLAEGLARFEEMTTYTVVRPKSSWAGLRTFAPDRALVIGEDPRARGLHWLAGQGGYGFQTAVAAGRLIADRVLGRTPELDAELVAALAPGRLL